MSLPADQTHTFGINVPRALGKSILAPCLVHDERDGICKVQAAVCRRAWNCQPPLKPNIIEHRRGQATSFRAKEQRIAGSELSIAVALRSAGLHAEHANARQRRKAGIEIGVHADGGELGVIEARAAHSLVAQVEAARLDQVQGAAVLAQRRMMCQCSAESPAAGGECENKLRIRLFAGIRE